MPHPSGSPRFVTLPEIRRAARKGLPPEAWNFGAGGAERVARTLEILREEVRTAMGLCGRTRIADLTPDLIARVD